MAKRRKNKESHLLQFLFVASVVLYFMFPSQVEQVFKILVYLSIASLPVFGALYVFRRQQKSKLSSEQRSATHHKPQRSDRVDEGQQEYVKPLSDNKPTEWSIGLIKSLDWKCFEELCAAYFQATGRKAEVSGNGADGGVDIRLYRTKNPEKVLGVVQCKAWSNRKVGVKEIRELLGVMTDIGCPLGIFITSSEFTADAKTFAKGHKIKLLSGIQLLSLINRFSPKVQASILRKITQGDYKTPSCPKCGIKLLVRATKRGANKGQQFWGCASFPQCRYTMRFKQAAHEH